MSFAPTREEIALFCGPSALPDWVDAMARVAPELCEYYGFTRLDWCHFMGQIGAETNGMSLSKMEENMYFTTSRRIVQVYSYRLGVAIARANKGGTPSIARGRTRAGLAAKLVGQPKLLADIVYGGREGTPWMQGSRYIGRGPTQITHRDNYRAVGNEIARQPGGGSFDLVGNPELLATDPELGIRSAFADWKLKDLASLARQDSVQKVSDKLNTGNIHDRIYPHNLSGRERWTAKAKGIWPAQRNPVTAEVEVEDGKEYAARVRHVGLRVGDEGEDVRELQELLTKAGYPVGVIDGKFGRLTRRSVVNLQSEHDLVVDGIVGIRTWDVLETTSPEPLPEREKLTAAALIKRGNWVVRFFRRMKRFGQAIFAMSGLGGLLEASGVEVLETSVSLVDRIGGFVDRINIPEGLENPRVWIILGFVAVGLLGLMFAAWGKSAENEQVEKARKGEDLSGATA